MNDPTSARLPVATGTVEGARDGLPLVLTPGEVRDAAGLSAWLAANRDWSRAALVEHGALLFRGFGIDSPEAFEAVARGIDDDLKNDYLGTSPRDGLTDYVFSASELPGYYPIPQHCEMTFTANPPRRLFFWCGTEPRAPGGETPLVDFAKVAADMDPAVRGRFEAGGIRIVRNYAGPGTDTRDLFQLKRWDEMFRTTDKDRVTERARAEGFEPSWGDDDRLRLVSRHAPFRDDPDTGQAVWYNHSQVFHLSTASAELGRVAKWRPKPRSLALWAFSAALVAWKRLAVRPDDQALHCTYDDGSEIPVADMEHVRDLVWKHLVVYAWKQGDVVAINNHRIGHGRLPYTGPRRVAVCWA